MTLRDVALLDGLIDWLNEIVAHATTVAQQRELQKFRDALLELRLRQ